MEYVVPTVIFLFILVGLGLHGGLLGEPAAPDYEAARAAEDADSKLALEILETQLAQLEKEYSGVSTQEYGQRLDDLMKDHQELVAALERKRAGPTT